jgi:hypothetical protein
MKTFLLYVALLGSLFFLAPAASPVQACPNCKEAVAGSATESTDGLEDDDPLREARAFNHSIYLMVGMPYLLLTGFGLFILLAVVRHNRLNRHVSSEVHSQQTTEAKQAA